MPPLRQTVRQFRGMPLAESTLLVRSPIHEERLAGLLLWVSDFDRGGPAQRQRIYDLYLRHTRYINHWDLVDLSAPNIVGAHLTPRSAGVLLDLAKSQLLWERRIAMLATHAFIRQNHFATTLRLCRLLISDKHDLIHKACGWMLREIGKRDEATLRSFLDRQARHLPRTTLRYAIERFDPASKKHYMQKPR